MKRKISCLLLLCLLLCTLCALPSLAYPRISYGVDCFANQGELIKSGLRGTDVSFTEADFRQALGVSRVSSVTLLSLPDATEGVLHVGGVPAVTGQVISRENLSALSFVPVSASVESASFTFCANSTAGTTALTCTVRILDRINYAPTTVRVSDASLSVETACGISLFGNMKAEDPEGDELTYLIVSYPTRGSLTVTDGQKGSFRYTPRAQSTGSDSFSYVARDEYGNYSSVTTVNIRINKRNDTLVYADMNDHPSHNAALVMADKKIMLGSLEGDGMYFHPEETVSRGEFLVMAMKAAGISPAAGMEKTWFDDNDKIPTTLRDYVATAQLYGYVSGYFDGAGLYFESDRAITRAEAAVILNNLLCADTPASLPTLSDASDIPAWAAEAVYALCDAGILAPNGDGCIEARADLTRAEAADALYALMQYAD